MISFITPRKYLIDLPVTDTLLRLEGWRNTGVGYDKSAGTWVNRVNDTPITVTRCHLGRRSLSVQWYIYCL